MMKREEKKMEEFFLKPGERLDDLQRNHYHIIQNPEKFCFGMDAVLLSGFTLVKPGERLLDIGTGTGIIPLLLAAKTKGEHFTGLEIQEESADMARRSVSYNGLEERISVVTGDIKKAESFFSPASFHVITTNPPYMIEKHGIQNPDSPKAIARHGLKCTLEDIVRQSSRLLIPGGRFYMVHRPFRLAEIITTLTRYRLEPKRMRLVYPFIDREPNMVLLECYKDGKSRMTVEKPLVLFSEPGCYTEEIKKDYGF